eukprot:COSAG01_NODE_431_length_17124_cov_26.577386_8_plen_74_part_00
MARCPATSMAGGAYTTPLSARAVTEIVSPSLAVDCVRAATTAQSLNGHQTPKALGWSGARHQRRARGATTAQR